MVISRTKVIVGVAVVVLVIIVVAWAAYRLGGQPGVAPAAGNATSTAAGAATSTPTSTSAGGRTGSSVPTPTGSGSRTGTAPVRYGKYTRITMISPTSNAVWSIGQQHTIQWNQPGGVTGQLSLVNASDGTIAGWIQQNIAPTQTYFVWDARSVYVSSISSAGRDVVPGEYLVKLTYDAPDVSSAVSAPFWITAATTTAN